MIPENLFGNLVNFGGCNVLEEYGDLLLAEWGKINFSTAVTKLTTEE
jgi:hypothetical protein